MSRYHTPAWASTLYRFVAWMTEDFGGGPKQLRMAWVINFHKIFTLFIILGMMSWLENFTTTAWVYLGLHGIYGYCWLVKDFGFRDSSFNSRVTWGGALMAYLLLVGWYWLFPWFFLTRPTPPSNALLFAAIAVHTWGITWMIAADCQKHFQLKYRKGLVTGGMFRYTRNPNFFGEILIYLAYAMLAAHWLTWIVFAYAILYFYTRMLVKDGSISRYPEWDAYESASSRLIPWRILVAPFTGSAAPVKDASA
jgi:protein-S-isoprenylcysteine O-methyltransferase Ste14